MTIDGNNSDSNSGERDVGMPSRDPRERIRQRPEWADGLRKLYDSVVEEPLPDSFRDLLDKLDRQP